MHNFNSKIGKLGEDTLSLWCSEAGLTSNRSLDEDETGWDHQIEFPFSNTSLPRDLLQSPIECRIQVKSTQRRDKKCAIKLSAIHRLINYSSPAFFLFLEFTNNKPPKLENAYLVHIDSKIIERALKKIRINDTCRAPKELHKLTLSISYSSHHKLPIASATEFLNAIVSHVPNHDLISYQKRKSSAVKTTGYNQQGSFLLKFEAKPNELQDYLHQHSIGLTPPPIKITSARMFDNRFNLPEGAVEINASSEAELEIHSRVVNTGQLRFRESKYTPYISFSCELVTAPILSEPNSSMLVIRTKLFSIELTKIKPNHKFDASIHFRNGQACTLDEATNMFRLLSERNAGKSFRIELCLTSPPKKIQMNWSNNNFLENGDILSEALPVIKQKYNLDGGMNLYIEDILEEAMPMLVLSRALQNKSDGIRINVSEGSFGQESEEPETASIPKTYLLKIGEIYLGGVILIEGNRVEPSTYEASKIEVLEPLMFSDGIPSKEEVTLLEEEILMRIS